MIQFVLKHIPAPRYAREYALAEQVMIQIAALTGYPYKNIQAACREVASHYPVPAHQTIGQLYIDIAMNWAGDQPTALAQDFYREYEKVKQGS